jgi:hypothetical protein
MQAVIALYVTWFRKGELECALRYCGMGETPWSLVRPPGAIRANFAIEEAEEVSEMRSTRTTMSSLPDCAGLNAWPT